MALPDFFVIGAPKAGTTALHAALARHPELFLSPAKEPKFFLGDERPPTRVAGPGDAHSAREWIWARDEHEALFDAAPRGSLRGESTPFYLYDPLAHDRIQRLVPAAKLIATGGRHHGHRVREPGQREGARIGLHAGHRTRPTTTGGSAANASRSQSYFDGGEVGRREIGRASCRERV